MALSDDKKAQLLAKEQTKWAQFDEAQINKVTGILLESNEGQVFLWWLLQIGKVGTQPFAPNQPDYTNFQCGELNVGNAILQRIVDVNPIGYAEMMKKRKLEDERRNDLSARASNGDDLYADGDGGDGAPVDHDDN